MDAHRAGALLRSLTKAPSRRSLLALLVGTAFGAPLETDGKKRGKKKKVKLCHQGKTIKIRKSARRSHLRHGDTPGACPAPIDAGCSAGSQIIGTRSFNTIRQFSQTFLSPRAGVLAAAACEVRNFAEGADFALEIRPLDALTGEPEETVLASALLPNRPETGDDPIPLAVTFDPPAPVQEDDGYALVVTMTGVTGDFVIVASTGAGCSGRLLVTNDEGEFQEIAADMVFSATIV
jgi:hypothetical protein